MSKLIVIRIIPQTPVDPSTFTGFLNPSLGPLNITAYDLSFDNPDSGESVGSASFVAPSTGPMPTAPVATPPEPAFASPQYSPSPTGGIVQQYDLMPGSLFESAYYQLESVATAIIEIPSAASFENLKLVAQWGIGASAVAVPVPLEYYNVALSDGPAPDLNFWNPPTNSASAIPDPWAALPPSLYLQVPVPPTAANALTFRMPTNGTAPAFDALLAAMKQILKSDPGNPVTAATNAPALAGGVNLPFASATGIVDGMSVSGAGVPAGTTVAAVSGTTVELSHELSALVPSGSLITFAPDVATLSFDQCRNIAYEIIWIQQQALPAPPDPVEDLYTNPPNNGILLSGSTPNQHEGDRQQFEAQLTGYYSTADTTADQLTSFVYAVAAAVACEQLSLQAAEVLLDFPVNPGAPASAPFSETSVILTGVGPANPTLSFGVPAAYFYALAAMMPVQVTVGQRYQIATGNTLLRLLTDLTTSINSDVITDNESFVTPGFSSINAAQAARRMVALGVPPGSATAPAALDTVELLTAAAAASGSDLSFTATAGVAHGMLVSGPQIAPNTIVSAVGTTDVSLSAPILDNIPKGSNIVFSPTYPADLQSLVQAWLNFPASVPGQISSQIYQPSDDDDAFWPQAAAAQPSAFLNLVLSALTQGYIIPPPFSVSLGDQIIGFLKTLPPNPASPTVANLAAVTAAEWTAFFEPNPTWLPLFTQPGNTDARIAAFIRYVQKFFDVVVGGPPSEINLATTASTSTGGTVLQVAPTNLLVAGMSVVSGSNIPLGTTISAVATSATATSVTISQGVSVTINAGTNVVFSPNLAAGTSPAAPLLQAPSVDWLARCLGFYGGAFTFGSGFNLTQLQAAAAQVFPGDIAAQNWLVDALVTIDALMKVLTSVALPPPATAALQFSVMEALYARGFKSAADITRLSADQFQTAVTGTIAYDLASAIYSSAVAIAPPNPVTQSGSGFQPVNDGSLTNCIPPECFSPLGPIEYLKELLQLWAGSTCEKPVASSMTVSILRGGDEGSVILLLSSTAGIAVGMSASGLGVAANTTVTAVAANTVTLSQGLSQSVLPGTEITFAVATLADAISQRCGAIGNLDATCANCDIPLPLIDIVNEKLEYMASVAAPSGGVVYNTASDVLDGYKLCQPEPCVEEHDCHDPVEIYAALPQYSTPGAPNAANSAVEPVVYETLKSDFSSCRLPYSQPLDISRTYLRFVRSCRFEEMRTFRKCITEFVLDPTQEPAGFPSHAWRYPVRIDTAIEYLGITPEEYAILFQGDLAKPCAEPQQQPRAVGQTAVWQLYGFASPGDNTPWIVVVSTLPEFLKRTCLSYCEFYELWKSGYVDFRNGADEKNGAFPQCEPCCLEKLSLQFPERDGAEQGLLKLAIFIRLWRKLRESCCFCYSFDHLRDICDVLQLFNGAAINPDFIRQLAAFQMLRDHFQMELADSREAIPPAAIDADRTQLLALWVGPSAAKWNWAVNQLIFSIERYAQRHHHGERRAREFVKILVSNLDPISRLAGFDPSSTTDNWHALPTHALRFAEVLAKIYASNFSVGELLYLFTAGEALDGDDPFPLQEENEALDFPLGLPDDEPAHSLVDLRRKLLHARVEEDEEWSWKRIESALEHDLGFAAADVVALGRHFFPGILRSAGDPGGATTFVRGLSSASTSEAMWNMPPGGPFEYDSSAQQLSTRIPLTDEAVIAKLSHVHSLNPDEEKAVQDIYFQPRAMLAGFAMIFSDFAEGQARLIEERDERERWRYFRAQFALCHRRCRVIAEHLSRHAAAATGQKEPEGDGPALLVLRDLYADENKASASWENDGGTVPPVTWTPPAGGAFAALLGLAGTGLVAEYKQAGSVVWRDVSGPLAGFGRERNHANAPVPTVLPSMSATLTPPQMKFVSVHNGFLTQDSTGTWLGGAQGFEVRWSGALLVDREGSYEFRAEAGGEHRRWRVVLKRGQRTWIVASRDWPGEADLRSSSLPLKSGAYELSVEFAQAEPEFHSDEQVCPLHTGFELQYGGPDTGGEQTAIPHHRLIPILKENTLGYGITPLSAGAASYLSGCHTSSLRDIRRTYQRAFKALMLVHRFELSEQRTRYGTSELGYLLSQSAAFAGLAYYRSGGAFAPHAADLNFNFFPLRDDYHPPAQDSRSNPSPQRMQAIFDWWERLFDYTRMRQELRRQSDRHLWLLFEEAESKNPAHPDYLLRHIGADSRHWSLDLRYFQGQNIAVYSVSSKDLEDERWTTRAWRADGWLRALECSFTVKDIAAARPDLWASDDPAERVAGETATGNANLSKILCDGCFDNGEPRRYRDVARLNDGLRERGRGALVDYLCHMNRVPLPWAPGYAQVPRDLSDLLLIDVEAGVREKASRVQEAISAVQNFIRRARLHLEPGWTITPEFARMWEREFASFHVWQACKRRHLYKENWIEWDDMERARKVEAFRFLESRLRSAELTIAAPGGLEWWPNQRPPAHAPVGLIERREPSELRLLASPREGLNLMGTPERDARPSWLAAVPESANNTVGIFKGGGKVTGSKLPYWIQAAIRLGTRFYRIAAAGIPPAASPFAPHRANDGGCVPCCAECGCNHPAVVDEYYFWLVNGAYYDPPVTPVPTGYNASPGDYQDGYQTDYYDPGQQEAALWEDPTQLPGLLEWRGSPMVRLAWSRVHNGEFQQPRRSQFGVAINPGATGDLTFDGRTGDSLTFSVSNAVAPQGYLDTSAPGFRYDLAADDAIVLPQVAPPPPPPNFLGTLSAYPYFVFEEPGASLFPLTPYSPSLAIAGALRARCHFEPALEWYRQVFDPLQQDCTWVHCDGDAPPSQGGNPSLPKSVAPPARNGNGNGSGACCDSTDVTCDQARDRSLVLHYVETLVEWSEAGMRRRNSPESCQQSRVILDAARRILGDTPCEVRTRPPATLQTIATFHPEIAPLNPRLIDLYQKVRDRLDLIHQIESGRRLRNAPADAEYFGDDPLREGWRGEPDQCAEETEWCHLRSPYRFMFLIEKAKEYAGRVQELGAALLAAFEKGDAEFLASLRAGQERELLSIGLDARKDQWRDADWQIEALQKTKAVSQANLIYYNALINSGPGGLIDDEIQYQNLTSSAISLRGTANTTEAIGEALRFIPDIVLGAAGFGGSPVSISWIPLGTKIGEALEAVARIINNSAEINSMNAGLDVTNAGWERRLDEWTHQTQTLAIEIQQVERQILAAERRRDQALVELDSHRRQMEQAAEVQNFLRDKFTPHDLYLFLQKETAALYAKTYDLALEAARQAQRAFNLERGEKTRRFLPECAWDGLHEGLLAGERLSSELRRMEKTYLDENIREYELTKNFSLRLHFPIEFLRLRTTGACEIEIPEWMFDLDFPGHYMRRIRGLSLTIPCVTGPYTGVHCRMTLLGSMTRIDPRLRAPAHTCCCPSEPCCGECGEGETLAREYEPCADDPRIVRRYGAREAIATSTGQNDSGLFELRFTDERYLPFEYMGAVSRWRIELPPENNYFDLNSLSDAVIRLNYTAREGGSELRRAASEAAQRRLPGDGWCFFEVRHEFPDAWQLFRDSLDREHGDGRLKLRMDRKMFPFVPRGRDIWIDKMALLFGSCRNGCLEAPECPCPPRSVRASRVVEFSSHAEERRELCCVAGDAWPDLYCGLFDARLGPLGKERREIEFRFRDAAKDLERVFLLARYTLNRCGERRAAAGVPC